MITFQNWCKWSATLFLLLLSVFNCSAADWLCFTAEENGSTIWFENEGDNNPNMQYSLDGDSWYDWNDKVKITLENTNDKVYVRGDNPKGYSIKNTIYTHFGMDGKISASGSVMSLITKDESIIEIPNSNCFIKLFSDCKSLTQAPKLPATILKDSCYYTMFEKCESLAKAPELPAMTMTKDCYASMFRGCLSLTEAPSLPAMELATRCYSSMFSDCKNMEVAPELPATELAEACYSTMFTACEKLKKAPDLPAKKLANNCYFFMFERCSGIESAVISATELGKQSCIAMFMSCTSLKYIKVGVKTLDNDIEATEAWVSGVTSEGIIEFPCGSNYDKNGPSEAPINFTIKASPIVVFRNPDGTVLKTDTIECGTAPYYGEEPPFLDEEHEFVKWDKDLTVLDEPDIYYYTAIYKDAEAAPLGNWLCFTAEEAGSQVFYKTTGDKEPTIYYSFNGKNWDQLKYGETITLEEKGDKVYIKGDNPDGFSHSDEEYTTFFMYGRIAASGNVMSLIDGEVTTTKIPNSNCFRCLFKECQSLTKAPELPATELTQSCYAIMFAGCTSLTEAPELPATTLAASCYYYMFSDCISLKEAPALPATNLASACYFCTFINCENITKAPELPAKTLKTHCYQGMFQNCKKLTEAPVLPAIEMEKNCYTDMFHGCTSLTKVPELPATTLAESCYYNMFKSTGLTEAPKLPAKTLQPSCYTKMFNGCTSLTKAPELPAQSLVESCYKEMFQGCTSLNYIKVGVMSLDNDFGATENWVDGIDGEGLFIFPCGSKYDKKGPSEVPQEFVIQSSPIVIFQNPDKKELWRDTIGCDVVPEYPFEEKGEPFYKEGLIFKGWDIEPHIHETPDTYYYTAVYGEEGEIDLNKILCFTALEPSSTISYGCMDVICPDLQFSRDSGKTWNSMEAYVEIKLDEGEKVYFRGNNPNGFSHGIDDYTYFTLNGRISASGSVMSLLDEKGELTEIPCDHCFSNLFNHCSLVDAPELPATKLTKGCYDGMFTSCYNLKKAPVLPAIEVKDHSYSSMFSGCISLTETPELPATVLGERCYYGMFAGCTGLTKAHDLPAMKLEKACYAYMFTSCQNLAVPPALPATELADSCYNYMFLTCNNITRAPLLPATTLKKGCYDHMFTACINLEIVPDFGATVAAENSCDGMFISCYNLRKAPALPATELDENCYHLMFAGCTNLAEAPELPAKVMKNSCYESMFNSCISLEKAPELLAKELANGCYKEMFVGCGKLNYIKVGITTLDNEFNATENWVDGDNRSGVFIFPCGSTYDKHGVSEVPVNFKIIASPIVIFQNPDSTVLYSDTINCGDTPKYEGETPEYGDGLVWDGWDKPLEVLDDPDVYYYTAVYKEGENLDLNKILCFTAEEAGSEISYIYIDKTGKSLDVQYSINEGETWHKLEQEQKITLENVGDKIYFKGNNPNGLSNGRTVNEDLFMFRMKGKIAASGSIMSLIDGKGETTVIPCDGCFAYLFAGCEALTKAPELTATELKDYCYLEMFNACWSLTEAPKLPAETLAKSCYLLMFDDCRSLTQAPELPASKLADGCYMGMFEGCTSLTQAPELPATKLAESCYNFMFGGCASLIKIPELPATELATECYNSMFEGCSSITKAPELPATELADNCYANMFYGCTNLNYIKVGVMSLDNEIEATTNWVNGVDGPGVFIFPCGSKYDKHGVSEVPDSFKIISSPIVIFQNPDSTVLYRDTIDCGDWPSYERCVTCKPPYYGDSLVFINWDKELEILKDPDIYYYTAVYEKKGEKTNLDKILCFTAEEAGSTISYINTIENPEQIDVQYSIDEGESWHKIDPYEKVTLEKAGDKVYFKGNNPNGLNIDQEGNIFNFEMEGKIAASGSIMSLIDGVGETTVIPCNHCFEMLFLGCDALTQAPELTATVLTESCYHRMFDGCSSLTKAPELPAKDLARYCYILMFDECTSLTQAPELPATKLADGCYMGMFDGCTSLTQAPVLPATELAEDCYSNMFARCTSLINVPELPATNLTVGCYDGMFAGCSSLTKAPELPATKLAAGCYNGMFDGCSSLTKAPELPAEELVYSCYENMFYGCTNLNYIKVGVKTLDNELIATENWVKDVDGAGTFIFPCGSKYDKHGISEVPDNFKIVSSPIIIFQNPDSTVLYRDTISCDTAPVYYGVYPPVYKDGYVFKGWDVEPHIHETPDTYYYTAVYDEDTTSTQNNWLCFTAEEDESKIWYTNTDNDPDVQYSLDEGKTWNIKEPFEHIVLNKGDKIYFKGNNPNGFSHGENAYSKFFMAGKLKASGSVMSLIDGKGTSKEIPSDYCFHLLFNNCISLTEVPELPATKLTKGCYYGMFGGCTQITKAPKLPATEMKESCYDGMFYDCTSLETPPALPAMKLADNCYSFMFTTCTGMKEAPELPATEMATGCYSNMFGGCNFETPPALPAKKLAEGCYESMFIFCKMKEAPELPATEMAKDCYAGMFGYCELLETPPALPATNLAERCYSTMFQGCTSLTTAPKLPAKELAPMCYAYMFRRCTKLEKAPELPAKELVNYCYEEMFSGCSNLNYIKVGVMTLDNELNATENWVNGVDGPGTFIFPCGTTYDKHGYSEVPLLFEIKGYESTTDSIITGCDSIVYDGITYYDTKEWNDTLSSVDGCDSIIAYHLIVNKSTVKEETIYAEKSFIWHDIIYTEDATWDDSLTSVSGCDSVIRYNLIINKSKLNLDVRDDDMILILPGDEQPISYILTGGNGSKYEIRDKNKLVCSGEVANDSTVNLICPNNMEPGLHTVTMEMCDEEGNCAKDEFEINVMLPDDKQKSYYVRVWNDVVICRNGDGKFVSYQWYKNREMIDDASLQYFNDISILDGEYMVFVTDKDGKSYFIEPIHYEAIDAAYSITATPGIVDRGKEFTLTITGVEANDLQNARIVVYRVDGTTEKILNKVEEQQTTMQLRSGDYVIVLTVNDGKNANCKVLVK